MEDDTDTDAESQVFVYDATLGPGDVGVHDLLCNGSVEVLGLMPWSSNGTYLTRVTAGADHTPAIYKPERGERPLWDFPGGLWRREVAAWELSDLMGFGLVPPTVARLEGPLGPGSLQVFVPAHYSEHYFTVRDVPALGPSLRALCAFDIVANSTDRKAGHCLIDDDGRVWAIDNGLTFHADFKVRTVIWDFAGEPLPETVRAALEALDRASIGRLSRLLDDHELDALLERADDLLDLGEFPHDPSGRRVPWPLV